GVLAANTLGATISITEDCFYDLDACGICTDFQAGFTAAAIVRRVVLEILDTQGKACWAITRTWTGGTATAVGFASQADGGDIQLRLHLLAGMAIQWRLVDATVGAFAVFSSSLALRKLYQETL